MIDMFAATLTFARHLKGYAIYAHDTAKLM